MSRYKIVETGDGGCWVDTSRPVSNDPCDGFEGVGDEAVVVYITTLETQLAEMYAKHPEQEGCYEALPKLRAQLAERDKENQRLRRRLADFGDGEGP